MKKATSIALALLLTMGLSTTAFAATDGYADQESVTLKKSYTLTNEGTVSPAETFTFSALTCTSVTDAADGITKDNAPLPTIANNAVYAKGDAGSATKTKDITINLPTYESVGIYTYSFTENAGVTAGVSYRSDEFKLVVTVIEQNGKVRVAGLHAENKDGVKTDTFEDNTYSAGSLAVSKEVTGQLGDKTKEFKATVTFTAPEGKTVNSDITYVDGTETKTIAASAWKDGKASAEITLKNGETVNFANIPYDVTYSVVEDDYTTDGYDKAKYTNSDDNLKIDSAKDTVKITNNKGTKEDIDTGVYTNNMPYVVVLSLVVCAGIVMVVANKRRKEN